MKFGPETVVSGPLGRQACSGTAVLRALGRQVGPGTAVLGFLGREVGPGTAYMDETIFWGLSQIRSTWRKF